MFPTHSLTKRCPRVVCAVTISWAIQFAPWSTASAETIGADRPSTEDAKLHRSPPRLARRGRPLTQAYYIGKNHELVRYAFRESVDEVNRATVRVLCDGKFVSFGTVISADGWILTKASELSEKIICRIPGRGSLEATLHKTDDQTDLALIQVDATDLTAVKPRSEWVASDSELRAGTFVAVPGGYAAEPLAIGIVSTARARNVEQQQGVVGIQVNQREGNQKGARVVAVIPGSVAEESGIKRDDLVLEVDGEILENHLSLVDRVSKLRPGTVVTLKLKRGEEEWDELVELGRLDDLIEDELALQNRLGGRLSVRRSGFPEVIQHDSLVRANQCGGPLVNLDGETIGINIARAGRVETFALTSKAVGEALERLMPEPTLTSETPPL